MAALGLHRRMAVHARGETGPHAYDDRGHVDRRAEVFLGEDRIDDHIGSHLAQHIGCGVHDDGDVARIRDRTCLRRIVRQAGAHALDARLAQADGLAKRHGAADARRLGDVGHHHGEAGTMQAQRDARGDIARPSHVDQHVHSSHQAQMGTRARRCEPR